MGPWSRRMRVTTTSSPACRTYKAQRYATSAVKLPLAANAENYTHRYKDPMKQASKTLLLITILLCAAAPSGAQKKEEAARKGLLKFPVWVETADGQLWREGKRQSFKVFLDEKEVALKSFQGPRQATIILVVFDTVADLASVEQARTALGEEIKTLGENYWLGLLRAQDSLAVLQEPTADRALINEKIQGVQLGSKAGLLDTLEPITKLATEMLQKAGVRLCVLYITDSGIAHYRADYLNPVVNASDAGDLSRRFSDRVVQERMSRLAEALAPFTIPLFILHLEQRSDTLNLAYQSGLERIAAQSGGQTIFCRTPDEIKPSLANLLARLQATYFVGIETPAAQRQSLRLRVTAQDEKGEPFANVAHATQLTLHKR